MTEWQGSWIWTAEETADRNVFVRFRRKYNYQGGPAALHITADSRYVLYVNGEYVGQGPVRAWPSHWRYDTYHIEPYLVRGENVIAVLANHYGEGNFQYIHGPAGLLVQLEMDGETVVSDGHWKTSPDSAFANFTPRISLQEGFEEQFDARKAEDWQSIDFDDDAWSFATEERPAQNKWHKNLEPRGIPFLTLEPISPQRVSSKETVHSVPYRFNFYPRPYLAPSDHSSNMILTHSYAVTQVWSEAETDVRIWLPHNGAYPLKVNGQATENDIAHLRAGWNSIVGQIRGLHHLTQFAICADGPDGLRFSSCGDRPSASWAVAGPFHLGDQDVRPLQHANDDSVVVADSWEPSATRKSGDDLWESGDVASLVDEPYFQQVSPKHLPEVDVFLQAYTDNPVDGAVSVEHEEALLSGSDWATIHPAANGEDVRILLDFGKQVVGFHRFEVVASEGTIIDLHNFEFIQPDGRYNFAEGMNNTCRYICREGRQIYQTYVRRGFRYTYVTLRNLTEPVQIRRVESLFSAYPQTSRGTFTCSDTKLDKIWEVGAHTLRCCSEDTYTDCPTYEQTHWVGDARNEALIDWAINGDPRLWYRCLEQAGDSLERSPLTESHVPSSWRNLLPAWSFLWMRSCREYLLYTGDKTRSKKLLSFVERNIDGIKRHLNAQGLFDIRAWNMFDWAAMDTPADAVVTHQNCMAVHALRDVAEMAEWLDKPALAEQWRSIAASMSDAINLHLWNDEKGAYTDCARDGEHSSVYSQQTQTVAYMGGVAVGDRAARCRDIMSNPPEGFVTAGSPFFEFFLLEAYQHEGRQQEFLDTIRKDWGFMIDAGATTFWEMWTIQDLAGGQGTRLTRSHCHGWSAAPTYFLSSYVLGVKPGGLGYSPTIIEPHPGDLKWCRGTVPTPLGDINVQWENEPDKPFIMRITGPKSLKLTVQMPRDGSVTLNGQKLPVE